MSPARLHRERLAAAAAMPGPSKIVSGEKGGQPALPEITPALEHRLTTAIAAAAASGSPTGELASGVDPAVAQIMLRLTHDQRRLKEIKARDLKIAAKREMLPDYRAWCDLQLEAGRAVEGHELPSSGADDVLPTMMVWSIDVADWPRALELAEHVLRFHIPLPSRYQRSAADLIVEEIADTAIAVQVAGDVFPIDVLEAVEALTADDDIFDEIRAKLMKAIGAELARIVDDREHAGPDVAAAAKRALVPLRRAQALNPRAGAKDKIRRMERAILQAATGHVLARAIDLGGTPAEVGTWFSSFVDPSFGKTPKQLVIDGRADEVIELLNAVDSGAND